MQEQSLVACEIPMQPEHAFRQRFQPGEQCRDPSLSERTLHLRANKANGTLDVPCGKRVLDRLLAQSSGFEPGTRFGVKRLFFRDVQACAQGVDRKSVV